MATFVLVHGAWLWASAWHPVAEILAGNGHRVITPWLTGLGEKSDGLSANVNLDTHVADVARRLDEDDLTDAVVVGHGYAGMIITGVAASQRRRLTKLVYLDAYVPAQGCSAWDLIPELLRTAFLRDARRAGDGWRLPPNERYYSAWGLLPGPQRELVRRNATDFSLPCLQTPLRFAREDAPTLPRAFICGTREHAARGLFAQFARRARDAGWPVYDIEAGHLVHVEKAAELADVLCRIAVEI